MTPKQRRFVEEYLIDLNGTQAAIRAGYSARTANEQAARLLANVSIMSEVRVAMAKRSQRVGITQDEVLREYRRLALSDMRRLMTWDADGVSLKHSSELTDDEAACVAEVSETKTKDGGSIKLKVHDKKGALDSVARHLGMFVDKTEVSGHLSTEDVSALTPEERSQRLARLLANGHAQH